MNYLVYIGLSIAGSFISLMLFVGFLSLLSDYILGEVEEDEN